MFSKKKDDPDYKYLKQIEAAAQRAAVLVKQILIFSRKVESRLAPLNLNDEVENVNKILKRTLPKMIEIKLDLVNKPLVINADATQLQQVMMNLAVNSKDVMPDGGELVFKTEIIDVNKAHFYGESKINPGKYVLFSVSDTGTGIDDNDIEHIFEPFFTTKGVGEGTGLGLSMVYGIVQNHGGVITCTSRIGKGTKFKIYFPWYEVEELTEYADEYANDADEHANDIEEKKINPGNEAILVVDDEHINLDIAEKMLKRYGYEILTANSGETAIEIYKKNISLIDMVILDLGMPGIGGYKCLALLRDLNPHLKILVASGYATKDIDKVFKLGAAGFISKPYTIKNMTEKVRNILKMDTV
jgi:CheY-like chemotaxis protein